MNRVAMAVCFVAATCLAPAQEPVPTIAPGHAGRFLGTVVTICGRVVAYDCGESRDMVLLNLDKPYWSGEVSIGIASALRPAFGERLEARYLWTNVCATGRVERVDDRFVLVVEAPASLVVQSPRPEPDAIFAPAAVYSCAPDVELPTLTREVKPRYTRAAMVAGSQGRMVLEAAVLPDGTVGDVRVLVSLDRTNGLDQEGVAAVKKWRFAPGKLRGQPVPMIVTIELTFRLKK